MFELLPSTSFLFFGAGTYLYYYTQPTYIRHGLLLWLKLVRVLPTSTDDPYATELTSNLRLLLVFLSPWKSSVWQ